MRPHFVTIRIGRVSFQLPTWDSGTLFPFSFCTQAHGVSDEIESGFE